MGDTVIPAEAVEAAAAAIQVRVDKTMGMNALARATLEAAAPYLMAQALCAAADAIDEDLYDDLDPFYAGWLRDRARKMREAGE
jgi:hypothetical protein